MKLNIYTSLVLSVFTAIRYRRNPNSNLEMVVTFVKPSPFRSTFAELSVEGVTRVCSRRAPLLFTISSHGNSVACWKNDMSGHRRRTSLSICNRNSLSLKNVLQALSGPSLSGWSDVILLLVPGAMTISSGNSPSFIDLIQSNWSQFSLTYKLPIELPLLF